MATLNTSTPNSDEKSNEPKGKRPHVQRYLVTGTLTVIPIAITYFVFSFFLQVLTSLGEPWVRAVARILNRYSPAAANVLLDPWFQSGVALTFTLVGLYLLGWLTTHVLGRRLIALFDGLINRIPVVKKVYGATKKLVSVLQAEPGKVHRVVLIEFPNQSMKTIGFVTRVIKDEATGRELAAVYVPTTPNPTSGYLEIVPVEQLVSTNMSMDEAMSFIISGGAVAPEFLRYTKPNNDNDLA